MAGNTVEVIIGNHAYQPPGRFKSVVQRRHFFDALNGIKPPDDLVVDPFNGRSKDWTGIIADECYKPCAENKIFALSSVDFSPTTLEYLKEKKPDTYELILKSHAISKINYGGHSSHLMQGGYDHVIFPFEIPETSTISLTAKLETSMVSPTLTSIFPSGRNSRTNWYRLCAAFSVSFFGRAIKPT